MPQRILITAVLAAIGGCSSAGSTRASDAAAMCPSAFPSLTLSADAVDFGAHAVGSSTDRAVTITNAGSIATGTLSVGSGLYPPFTLAGGAFPGAGGSCGAPLAAGQSCSVVFSFSPANRPSSFADYVFFEYVDPCTFGGAGNGGGPQPPSLSVTLIGSSP